MANTLKIKRGTAATIPQGQLAEPLFTTDTYDLYIGKGSGGNQRIQNYIASGTSSQFLKGDGSLDSNTYQTALTFSSPLVNTSGTVTINQSSGSVDGYLSSTDWTTFNSKEPAITASTTLQYYRGDKTFQTLDTSVVPENGPIYFTEPRVRATVLTGLNLSGGGTIAATDSILTAFGKVQNQISALVGGATYQGTWNASTNTPTLASGTGTKGYYYIVSVNGTTDLDGITDWKVGDWAIFNGTTWDKVDNTDAVSSVNGFTGAVNLALDNISDVSAASPTNAQLLRFNGTSSLWENWTPTFEPALTKGNLDTSNSSFLSITGGTGAVIGSGTTLTIYPGYIVNSGLNLTTNNNSGAATFSSATLNIPNYTFNGLSPMTTLGDIIYGGASGAGTRLAGNIVASKRFLVQTGDGTNSAAPSWGTIAAGDVPTLNQNTTGSAATLTTSRNFSINGSSKSFNGSADVSWTATEIGLTSYLPLAGGTMTGQLIINATNTIGAIGIVNTSSSNKTWDISPFGNALYINESGISGRMIFNAGGNISVGTTHAGLRMNINGTEGVPATSGTSQNGYLRGLVADGDFVIDFGSSIGNGTAAQYTSWIQATDKTNLATTYKISLNPNGGNVGIGKLNPQYALDVVGTGYFSGAVDIRNANTYFGSTKGYIYITEDQINSYFSSNAEATLNINYYGYDQGLTQFRNFNVFNGKGSSIFYLSGSTGAATFSSSIAATSATFSATYSAGGTVNIMQWQRSGGAVAADMTYNDANTSMNFGTSTAHALNLKTGGTTALSISSTGAATFSSSVTVKGDVYVWGGNAAQSGQITANSAGGGLYIAASGTNQNIRIVPSGTGIVQSLGPFDVQGAATFSGNVTASLLVIKNSGVPALQLYRDLDVTVIGPASQGIELGARNGASTYVAGASIYGRLDNPATTGALIFQTLDGGTLGTRLTISNTGAATFSGALSGTSATFSNTSGNTLVLQKGTGPNILFQKTNATAQDWSISPDPNFNIYNITAGTTPFSINASTGAATFSSSVTATDFIANNRFIAKSGAQSNPTGAGSVVIDYQSTSDLQGRIRSRDWDGAAWKNLTIEANNIILSPSGNVGIGSTSAGYKLTLTASSAANADIFLAGMTGVSNGFTVQRVSSSFVYSMNDGNLTIGSGSIKTGAPAGGTAKPWKFGARVAAAGGGLNSGEWIELDVDGTLYKLALFVPL